MTRRACHAEAEAPTEAETEAAATATSPAVAGILRLRRRTDPNVAPTDATPTLDGDTPWMRELREAMGAGAPPKDGGAVGPVSGSPAKDWGALRPSYGAAR